MAGRDYYEFRCTGGPCNVYDNNCSICPKGKMGIELTRKEKAEVLAITIIFFVSIMLLAWVFA